MYSILTINWLDADVYNISGWARSMRDSQSQSAIREKGLTTTTHTAGRALVTRRFLSTMFRNCDRNYPIIDELVDVLARFLFFPFFSSL